MFTHGVPITKPIEIFLSEFSLGDQRVWPHVYQLIDIDVDAMLRQDREREDADPDYEPFTDSERCLLYCVKKYRGDCGPEDPPSALSMEGVRAYLDGEIAYHEECRSRLLRMRDHRIGTKRP